MHDIDLPYLSFVFFGPLLHFQIQAHLLFLDANRVILTKYLASTIAK